MSAAATKRMARDARERESVTCGEKEPGIFTPAGIEALYRTQAARLLRRFARTIGTEEAGEVVHDAFVKLAGGSGERYEHINCPEAFVTTVATNVLRDRARAAAREALHLRQGIQESDVPTDPQRLLESREALRSINAALDKMKPRRRRIFLLHRFEKMTYAQIGAEVGMSEKGIKTQIAKALAELRRAAGEAL